MTGNDSGWRRRARSAATCAVAALAAQVLAGCTGVASTTPWFGAADTVGAPRLREGVWRLAQPADKPCAAFDETRPLDTWPDCAMGLVVTASQIKAMHRDDGKIETDAFPYLLAAGDPPILQLSDASSGTTGYIYVWLQPTKLGADGRVVGLRGWRVLCAPPPPAGSEAVDYPGLTSSNGDCTAASRDALRAAAKAGQHDDPTDITDARWVRAGDR